MARKLTPTEQAAHDEEVRIVRAEYNRTVPKDSYVRNFVQPFDEYLSENRESALQRKLIRDKRMERFLKEMGVA